MQPPKHDNFRQKRSGQAGSALMSSLVMVGIAGILAAMFSQMGTDRLKAAQSRQIKTDYGIIIDYMNNHLSCDQSVTSAVRTACAQKKQSFIALTSNASTSLVAVNQSNPASGVPFSDWQVRASCQSSSKRIMIEARRAAMVNGSANVGKNPLTGKSEDWVDIFPKANLCADQLRSTASFTDPVALAEAKHLEYYASGRFKANGGDMQVTIKRKRGGTACIDLALVDGVPVPITGMVKTLKQGQTMSFAASVTAPAQYPWYCQAFGGLETPLGPGLSMTKLGVDYWEVHIEDAFDYAPTVNWMDMVWIITAVPL